MGSTLPSVASRLVFGLVSGMLVGACNQAPQSPTSPTTSPAPSTPPTPSGPAVTLSGIVSERFSGRPIEGVRVSIYSTIGRSSSQPAGVLHVASDAAGRYRTSGIPTDPFFWVVVERIGPQEYWQQCAATVRLTADTTQDLTLTSRANLGAGNSQPPPRAPGMWTISGVVFEMAANGRQPVADVQVTMEAGRFNPLGGPVVAETSTDATGRYLLCGPAEDTLAGLFAYEGGYADVYLDVGPGSDAVIDIEIKRR